MTDEIKLNPYQKQFVDAREQYVGLFGGVGNGKTYAGCCKILELAGKYQGNLCLVGRLTYPELRDSTREVFLKVLSMTYKASAYTFNKAENSVTLWNKSVIIFRHLDEYASLLSMNLGAFYIDQAEEVDEDVFLTLQSRLRRKEIAKLKGYVTGNPHGYNWIYYKFGIDKSSGESNYRFGDNYRMIVAPTIANKENLPDNYIAQLKESYSPEWYARYVDGSWDAFEGQIFDLTKITGFEKLPEIRMVLTAIDPAISKSKDACNTAICTLGVGVDGHIYDLETIAGKWSFLETLEEITKMTTRQHPEHLGVEDVAYQRALFEACARYFPKINVHDLKADKDKFRRAKSVSHIIAKGLLHTNNKDLMAEITAFTPDAEGKERKDRVDALIHCLHMVQQFAPVNVLERPNPYHAMTSGEIFLKKSLAEERRQYFEPEVQSVVLFSDEDDIESNSNYY